MIKVNIWVKPSCFVPEFDMTISVPQNEDIEEYVDEFLTCILKDEFLNNAEWGFHYVPHSLHT